MNRTHGQSLYLLLLCALVIGLFVNQLVSNQAVSTVAGEQLKLASILPKLEAIHQDAKSLLLKNRELSDKIQVGLRAQNDAQRIQAKGSDLSKLISSGVANGQAQLPPKVQGGDKQKQNTIDYAELDEFNKWVDTNLDYAVKNTQASADALREEASQNNGNVDYSEQAIKDGIEGVKYWQSAVIFQDKTLKHEPFQID